MHYEWSLIVILDNIQMEIHMQTSTKWNPCSLFVCGIYVADNTIFDRMANDLEINFCNI